MRADAETTDYAHRDRGIAAANAPDQPGCQMSRYLADLADRVAELCERIQVARDRMRARAGH